MNEVQAFLHIFSSLDIDGRSLRVEKIAASKNMKVICSKKQCNNHSR